MWCLDTDNTQETNFFGQQEVASGLVDASHLQHKQQKNMSANLKNRTLISRKKMDSIRCNVKTCWQNVYSSSYSTAEGLLCNRAHQTAVAVSLQHCRGFVPHPCMHPIHEQSKTLNLGTRMLIIHHRKDQYTSQSHLNL